MNEERKAKLKEQLDDYHEWPSVFLYKFIFPTSEETLIAIKQRFPEEVEFSVKQSSGGKYSSVSIREMVLQAETVFERYEDVSSLEGVIAL